MNFYQNLQHFRVFDALLFCYFGKIDEFVFGDEYFVWKETFLLAVKIRTRPAGEVKKAMGKKTVPERFDALVALTQGLKIYDFWIYDNDCWGRGGWLENAILALAKAWRNMLARSDAELGRDPSSIAIRSSHLNVPLTTAKIILIRGIQKVMIHRVVLGEAQRCSEQVFERNAQI